VKVGAGAGDRNRESLVSYHLTVISYQCPSSQVDLFASGSTSRLPKVGRLLGRLLVRLLVRLLARLLVRLKDRLIPPIDGSNKLITDNCQIITDQ
jgi:hypothetical protein